jgi:Glycosyltransferase family 92
MNTAVDNLLLIQRDSAQASHALFDWRLVDLNSTGAIYVYDDGGSGDTPASDVLQDHIDSGLVVYADTSATAGDKTQQLNQYTHCLNNYKRFHRWMAFIDVDEFIVLADETMSIPAMLKQYNRPGLGGVLLNWKVFGSSGWDRRPRGGVSNYYKCTTDPKFELNTYVKSIVNTANVLSVGTTVHYFTYKEGYTNLNTAGDGHTEWAFRAPHYDVMWINHYAIKSNQDFESRERRNALGAHKVRTKEWRDELDNAAQENCKPLVWRSHGSP